jgi:hypothetical protein
VRNSDRWLTPWTIVAIVAILGTVVLGISAGLVYLSSIGRDPSPVLDMITQVGTAAGALVAAGATLLSGARMAKVERNTGTLASAVYDVADAMPRPPAPPMVAARHAYADTAQMPPLREAAPAPRGS